MNKTDFFSKSGKESTSTVDIFRPLVFELLDLAGADSSEFSTTIRTSTQKVYTWYDKFATGSAYQEN